MTDTFPKPHPEKSLDDMSLDVGAIGAEDDSLVVDKLKMSENEKQSEDEMRLEGLQQGDGSTGALTASGAEGGGALSPLTGAYLLIVLSEPISDEHKTKMLSKLKQGLLSWDVDTCHVDFHSELNVIVESAPPGEELKGGERLIQFASDNLVVEVLINPQLYTLQQCMRNMLSSFTKHRHIIHGGYTFVGTGAWVLQDGAYPYHEFSHTFDEYDIQRVMRAYENSITINLHCCAEGEWSQERINKEQYTEFCQVKLNPPEVIQDMTVIESFLNYVGPFLVPQSTQQALPPSDVVGNIRFSHPTLYVFPGGQGDSALFGINGFNMLIDGGFSRKACFWDFSRHLDRLDAILITRLSNENTCGMSALLQRKTMSALYPQIGHVFANLPIKAQMQSSTTHPDKSEEGKSAKGADDNLLINVIEEGNFMLDNLRILNLKPQICFRERSCEPINLYHKVGHGKLDMYVVNPGKDAKELKEFMERWNENSQTLGNFRSGINIDGKELWLPIANLVSICALVVWIPDDPNDTVTRLLFPGSTPQHKILRGLEKLKSLEFIQKRVCLSGSLPKAKPASPAAKSSGYGKREMSSQRQSSVTSSKRVPRNVSSTREFGSDKLSERGDRLESRHRRIRSESTTKQQIRTSREKMDDEKKQVPEVKERRTKVSVTKKSEDKNLKEQKNQVAEAKLKENKKEANTAIKSRVVAKSTRPKVTEKSSITATATPSSTTASSMNKSSAISSSRSSITKSGASKLSKDASNKTKKAADTKSKRDAKPIRGGSGKGAAATIATGTTAVLVGAAAVATSTLKGSSNETPVGANKEDEQESIVEKHQIEEMEHEPVDHVDDIEPELERIKDEDDDAQDHVIREADIPTEELKEPSPKESPPTALPLAIEKEVKTPLAHIKTPDEVDDLPEHEAVEPEAGEDQAEGSNDQTEEEKITQDLQEKEQIHDVEEKSLEIPLPQDADRVAQTPESEGVQQQKDMSEIIVEQTNIEMRRQDEAEIEKEEKDEEGSGLVAQLKDTVEHVRDIVVDTFQSEDKVSQEEAQESLSAHNEKDNSKEQDLECTSSRKNEQDIDVEKQEIEENIIQERQADTFQSIPKTEQTQEEKSSAKDATETLDDQLEQENEEKDISLNQTKEDSNQEEFNQSSKQDKQDDERDDTSAPSQETDQTLDQEVKEDIEPSKANVQSQEPVKEIESQPQETTKPESKGFFAKLKDAVDDVKDYFGDHEDKATKADESPQSPKGSQDTEEEADLIEASDVKVQSVKEQYPDEDKEEMEPMASPKEPVTEEAPLENPLIETSPTTHETGSETQTGEDFPQEDETSAELKEAAGKKQTHEADEVLKDVEESQSPKPDDQEHLEPTHPPSKEIYQIDDEKEIANTTDQASANEDPIEEQNLKPHFGNPAEGTVDKDETKAQRSKSPENISACEVISKLADHEKIQPPSLKDVPNKEGQSLKESQNMEVDEENSFKTSKDEDASSSILHDEMSKTTEADMDSTTPKEEEVDQDFVANTSKDDNVRIDIPNEEDPNLKDSKEEDPDLMDSKEEDPGLKDSKEEDPGLKDSKEEDPGLKDSEKEDPGFKDSKEDVDSKTPKDQEQDFNTEEMVLKTPEKKESDAKTPKDKESALNTPKDKEVCSKTPKEEEAGLKTPKEEEAGSKPPNEEEAASRTPKEEEAGSKTPKEEEADSMTPKEEEAGSKTPKEEEVASKTPKEEEGATKTQKEEEAGSKTPKEEEAGSKTPKEEEAGSKIPKEEEAGSKTPKEEEAGSKTPNEEEAGSKTPKEEEAGSKTPKEEEAGSKTPKEEEAGSKIPKEEEAGSKTPKEEEAGSKTPNEEEAGSKTPKEEEAGSKTPKAEEAGSKTPKEEEAGSKTPKEEVGATKTQKEEEAGSKTPKEEEGGTKTQKEEEAGSKTQKEEEAGSKTPKEEEAGSKTPKEEEAGSKTSKEEEAGSKSPKEEEAGSKTPKEEEAGSKTPKEEEAGSKTPKEEEAGSKIPKEEEAGSKTPKEEEAGSKTPKEEEAASKTPKEEETGSKTPKEEEVGSKTPKEEEGATKTQKEEGAGSKFPKEEEAGSKTPKEEEAGSKTSKEEEPGSKSPKEEVGATKTQKEEEAGSKTPKEEEAGSKIPKEEEAGSKTPKEEEGATKTQKEEEAGSKTPKEEEAGSKTSNEEEGASRTPKEEEAASKTPKEEEAGSKTPNEEEGASRTPKEEEAATKTQKEEEAGSKTPKEEEAGSKTPKEEEASSKSPKEEEAASKTPKEEEAGSKTPKEEEAGSKTPKEEEAGSKTQKEEEAGSKTPKEEEAGSKTPKEEEAGSKTPKEEEAGSKTPKEEEAGSKIPKEEEAGSKTPKEEEAGSKTPKEEEAGSKTPKEEEAGLKTPKEEEAGSKTPKEEEAGSKSPKGKEAGLKTPKEEEAGSKTPKEEEAGSKSPKGKEVDSKTLLEEGTGSKAPKGQDDGASTSGDLVDGANTSTEEEAGSKTPMDKVTAPMAAKEDNEDDNLRTSMGEASISKTVSDDVASESNKDVLNIISASSEESKLDAGSLSPIGVGEEEEKELEKPMGSGHQSPKEERDQKVISVPSSPKGSSPIPISIENDKNDRTSIKESSPSTDEASSKDIPLPSNEIVMSSAFVPDEEPISKDDTSKDAHFEGEKSPQADQSVEVLSENKKETDQATSLSLDENSAINKDAEVTPEETLQINQPLEQPEQAEEENQADEEKPEESVGLAEKLQNLVEDVKEIFVGEDAKEKEEEEIDGSLSEQGKNLSVVESSKVIPEGSSSEPLNGKLDESHSDDKKSIGEVPQTTTKEHPEDEIHADDEVSIEVENVQGDITTDQSALKDTKNDVSETDENVDATKDSTDLPNTSIVESPEQLQDNISKDSELETNEIEGITKSTDSFEPNIEEKVAAIVASDLQSSTTDSSSTQDPEPKSPEIPAHGESDIGKGANQSEDSSEKSHFVEEQEGNVDKSQDSSSRQDDQVQSVMEEKKAESLSGETGKAIAEYEKTEATELLKSTNETDKQLEFEKSPTKESATEDEGKALESTPPDEGVQGEKAIGKVDQTKEEIADVPKEKDQGQDEQNENTEDSREVEGDVIKQTTESKNFPKEGDDIEKLSTNKEGSDSEQISQIEEPLGPDSLKMETESPPKVEDPHSDLAKDREEVDEKAQMDKSPEKDDDSANVKMEEIKSNETFSKDDTNDSDSIATEKETDVQINLATEENAPKEVSEVTDQDKSSTSEALQSTVSSHEEPSESLSQKDDSKEAEESAKTELVNEANDKREIAEPTVTQSDMKENDLDQPSQSIGDTDIAHQDSKENADEKGPEESIQPQSPESEPSRSEQIADQDADIKLPQSEKEDDLQALSKDDKKIDTMDTTNGNASGSEAQKQSPTDETDASQGTENIDLQQEQTQGQESHDEPFVEHKTEMSNAAEENVSTGQSGFKEPESQSDTELVREVNRDSKSKTEASSKSESDIVEAQQMTKDVDKETKSSIEDGNKGTEGDEPEASSATEQIIEEEGDVEELQKSSKESKEEEQDEMKGSEHDVGEDVILKKYETLQLSENIPVQPDSLTEKHTLSPDTNEGQDLTKSEQTTEDDDTKISANSAEADKSEENAKGDISEIESKSSQESSEISHEVQEQQEPRGKNDKPTEGRSSSPVSDAKDEGEVQQVHETTPEVIKKSEDLAKVTLDSVNESHVESSKSEPLVSVVDSDSKEVNDLKEKEKIVSKEDENGDKPKVVEHASPKDEASQIEADSNNENSFKDKKDASVDDATTTDKETNFSNASANEDAKDQASVQTAESASVDDGLEDKKQENSDDKSSKSSEEVNDKPNNEEPKQSDKDQNIVTTDNADKKDEEVSISDPKDPKPEDIPTENDQSFKSEEICKTPTHDDKQNTSQRTNEERIPVVEDLATNIALSQTESKNEEEDVKDSKSDDEQEIATTQKDQTNNEQSLTEAVEPVTQDSEGLLGTIKETLDGLKEIITEPEQKDDVNLNEQIKDGKTQSQTDCSVNIQIDEASLDKTESDSIETDAAKDVEAPQESSTINVDDEKASHTPPSTPIIDDALTIGVEDDLDVSNTPKSPRSPMPADELAKFVAQDITEKATKFGVEVAEALLVEQKLKTATEDPASKLEESSAEDKVTSQEEQLVDKPEVTVDQGTELEKDQKNVPDSDRVETTTDSTIESSLSQEKDKHIDDTKQDDEPDKKTKEAVSAADLSPKDLGKNGASPTESDSEDSDSGKPFKGTEKVKALHEKAIDPDALNKAVNEVEDPKLGESSEAASEQRKSDGESIKQEEHSSLESSKPKSPIPEKVPVEEDPCVEQIVGKQDAAIDQSSFLGKAVGLVDKVASKVSDKVHDLKGRDKKDDNELAELEEQIEISEEVKSPKAGTVVQVQSLDSETEVEEDICIEKKQFQATEAPDDTVLLPKATKMDPMMTSCYGSLPSEEEDSKGEDASEVDSQNQQEGQSKITTLKEDNSQLLGVTTSLEQGEKYKIDSPIQETTVEGSMQSCAEGTKSTVSALSDSPGQALEKADDAIEETLYNSCMTAKGALEKVFEVLQTDEAVKDKSPDTDETTINTDKDGTTPPPEDNLQTGQHKDEQNAKGPGEHHDSGVEITIDSEKVSPEDDKSSKDKVVVSDDVVQDGPTEAKGESNAVDGNEEPLDKSLSQEVQLNETHQSSSEVVQESTTSGQNQQEESTTETSVPKDEPVQANKETQVLVEQPATQKPEESSVPMDAEKETSSVVDHMSSAIAVAGSVLSSLVTGAQPDDISKDEDMTENKEPKSHDTQPNEEPKKQSDSAENERSLDSKDHVSMEQDIANTSTASDEHKGSEEAEGVNSPTSKEEAEDLQKKDQKVPITESLANAGQALASIVTSLEPKADDKTVSLEAADDPKVESSIASSVKQPQSGEEDEDQNERDLDGEDKHLKFKEEEFETKGEATSALESLTRASEAVTSILASALDLDSKTKVETDSSEQVGDDIKIQTSISYTEGVEAKVDSVSTDDKKASEEKNESKSNTPTPDGQLETREDGSDSKDKEISPKESLTQDGEAKDDPQHEIDSSEHIDDSKVQKSSSTIEVSESPIELSSTAEESADQEQEANKADSKDQEKQSITKEEDLEAKEEKATLADSITTAMAGATEALSSILPSLDFVSKTNDADGLGVEVDTELKSEPQSDEEHSTKTEPSTKEEVSNEQTESTTNGEVVDTPSSPKDSKEKADEKQSIQISESGFPTRKEEESKIKPESHKEKEGIVGEIVEGASLISAQATKDSSSISPTSNVAENGQEEFDNAQVFEESQQKALKSDQSEHEDLSNVLAKTGEELDPSSLEGSGENDPNEKEAQVLGENTSEHPCTSHLVQETGNQMKQGHEEVIASLKETTASAGEAIANMMTSTLSLGGVNKDSESEPHSLEEDSLVNDAPIKTTEISISYESATDPTISTIQEETQKDIEDAKKDGAIDGDQDEGSQYHVGESCPTGESKPLMEDSSGSTIRTENDTSSKPTIEEKDAIAILQAKPTEENETERPSDAAQEKDSASIEENQTGGGQESSQEEDKPNESISQDSRDHEDTDNEVEGKSSLLSMMGENISSIMKRTMSIESKDEDGSVTKEAEKPLEATKVEEESSSIASAIASAGTNISSMMTESISIDSKEELQPSSAETKAEETEQEKVEGKIAEDLPSNIEAKDTIDEKVEEHVEGESSLASAIATAGANISSMMTQSISNDSKEELQPSSAETKAEETEQEKVEGKIAEDLPSNIEAKDTIDEKVEEHVEGESSLASAIATAGANISSMMTQSISIDSKEDQQSSSAEVKFEGSMEDKVKEDSLPSNTEIKADEPAREKSEEGTPLPSSTEAEAEDSMEEKIEENSSLASTIASAGANITSMMTKSISIDSKEEQQPSIAKVKVEEETVEETEQSSLASTIASAGAFTSSVMTKTISDDSKEEHKESIEEKSEQTFASTAGDMSFMTTESGSVTESKSQNISNDGTPFKLEEEQASTNGFETASAAKETVESQGSPDEVVSNKNLSDGQTSAIQDPESKEDKVPFGAHCSETDSIVTNGKHQEESPVQDCIKTSQIYSDTKNPHSDQDERLVGEVESEVMSVESDNVMQSSQITSESQQTPFEKDDLKETQESQGSPKMSAPETSSTKTMTHQVSKDGSTNEIVEETTHTTSTTEMESLHQNELKSTRDVLGEVNGSQSSTIQEYSKSAGTKTVVMQDVENNPNYKDGQSTSETISTTATLIGGDQGEEDSSQPSQIGQPKGSTSDETTSEQYDSFKSKEVYTSSANGSISQKMEASSLVSEQPNDQGLFSALSRLISVDPDPIPASQTDDLATNEPSFSRSTSLTTTAISGPETSQSHSSSIVRESSDGVTTTEMEELCSEVKTYITTTVTKVITLPDGSKKEVISNITKTVSIEENVPPDSPSIKNLSLHSSPQRFPPLEDQAEVIDSGDEPSTPDYDNSDEVINAAIETVVECSKNLIEQSSAKDVANKEGLTKINVVVEQKAFKEKVESPLSHKSITIESLAQDSTPVGSPVSTAHSESDLGAIPKVPKPFDSQAHKKSRSESNVSTFTENQESSRTMFKTRSAGIEEETEMRTSKIHEVLKNEKVVTDNDTKTTTTTTVSEVILDPSSLSTSSFRDVPSTGIQVIDESLARVKEHLAKDDECSSQEILETMETDAEGNIITRTITTTITSTSIEESSEMTQSSAQTFVTTNEDEIEKNLESWGKPLGLPSPIRPSSPRGPSNPNPEPSKSKESRSKRQARSDPAPVYMDLAYVPHHGNVLYSDIEFFKRVRARYYVFSGVEPSREVFDALLAAKKEWEDKDMEVTIIPTYDSDTLGYWVAANEEALAELHIDLAPSASRCTINLQDHETSCAAYRLEF